MVDSCRAVPADTVALAPKMSSHLARSVVRSFQELLVDEPQERQVEITLTFAFVVERRSADPHQITLSDDAELWVSWFDH